MFVLHLLLAIVVGARLADAACNVIPTTERSFVSTVGEVSIPFARPGDTVTVRRPGAVPFAESPDGNVVTLEFHPPAGPVTTLPVMPTAAPADDPACSCSGGGCRCISFAFPDTDALVGSPADGHGLTGPVRILVMTSGQATAQIDELFLADTGLRNDVFPNFTALPAPNPLQAVGLVSDVLGAPDGAGSLLVPFDFGALLGPTTMQRRLQTRFVDASVPGLGAISGLQIDAFSPDGRRLPPLLRRLESGGHPLDELIGTVDFPASVLRIEHGIDATGLQQQDGKGPVVVPGVSASSALRNRADVLSLRSTSRFAIYENRECEHVDDPPELCIDLNADGDTQDYFLFALDLTSPGAQPIVIDQVDGADFAGYPSHFPPATLYNFVVTEKLVAFQIEETTGTDINGDGKTNVARTGAFDLVRDAPIDLASGSPRIEADDGILAFAVTDPTDQDVLYFYDADRTDPGPFLVQDASHPEVHLARLKGALADLFYSALSSCDISQAIACSVGDHPCNPLAGAATCNIFNLAVSAGRIGYIVDQSSQPFDECGYESGGLHLYTFDSRSGTIRDFHTSTFCGGLRMSPRWLAWWGRNGSGLAVGAYDLQNPSAPLVAICNEYCRFAVPSPSMSDSIVPCAIMEDSGSVFPECAGSNADRNGDGDVKDLVLQAYLPNAAGGPRELPLRLAVNTVITNQGMQLLTGNPPLVQRDTLLVGVDEQQQGNRDLNGDGVVGATNLVLPELPAAALFTFNAASRSRSIDPVSGSEARALFKQSVATSLPPLMQFIDHGASVIAPELRRNLLRDLDGDGAFEEETTLVDGNGTPRLDDNCPYVYNPGQEDGDGDGIGDACDPQTCGNGTVETSEECDDGNAVPADGCEADCRYSVCGNAAPIVAAKVSVSHVGDSAGATLVAKGMIAYPPGKPTGFMPLDTDLRGAQILLEDVRPSGTVVLFDLSHLSFSVPPGALSGQCNVDPSKTRLDGWKRTRNGTAYTYVNGTGSLTNAACAPGSARGLKKLRLVDRRLTFSPGVRFALSARGVDLPMPQGRLRLSIVPSAAAVDGAQQGACGAVQFYEWQCRTVPSTGRVACHS